MSKCTLLMTLKGYRHRQNCSTIAFLLEIKSGQTKFAGRVITTVRISVHSYSYSCPKQKMGITWEITLLKLWKEGSSLWWSCGLHQQQGGGNILSIIITVLACRNKNRTALTIPPAWSIKNTVNLGKHTGNKLLHTWTEMHASADFFLCEVKHGDVVYVSFDSIGPFVSYYLFFKWKKKKNLSDYTTRKFKTHKWSVAKHYFLRPLLHRCNFRHKCLRCDTPMNISGKSLNCANQLVCLLQMHINFPFFAKYRTASEDIDGKA